jgi:hypothetical protein
MSRGAKRKDARRTQQPRIEIYQDTSSYWKNVARTVRADPLIGGWRWRLVGANGKILADSGESYTRKADVKRALGTVFEAFDLVQSFDIVDLSLKRRS